MSDTDSERSVHDENIAPYLNSVQESEILAVPTKPEEAKTGRFSSNAISRWRKKKKRKWLSSYWVHLPIKFLTCGRLGVCPAQAARWLISRNRTKSTAKCCGYFIWQNLID